MNSPVGEGLLIGATGLLGPDVNSALVRRGFSFRVFRRTQSASGNESSQAVNVCVGDLSDLNAVERAVAGVDWIVYVPTNTKDKILHSQNIAQAARKSGVRLILKTSAILTGEEPPLSFGIEHLVAEDNIANAGAEWIVLRPSFFMQSFSLFAQPMRDKGKLVLPVPTGATAFIDTADVAECVAACLANPHPYLSKALPLTGPAALTMKDVARLLSAATGREIHHVAPPGFVARLFMRYGEKMDAWLVKRLLQMFKAMEEGREGQISPHVAEILGRPPTQFQDYLDRDAGARNLWV